MVTSTLVAYALVCEIHPLDHAIQRLTRGVRCALVLCSWVPTSSWARMLEIGLGWPPCLTF